MAVIGADVDGIASIVVIRDARAETVRARVPKGRDARRAVPPVRDAAAMADRAHSPSSASSSSRSDASDDDEEDGADVRAFAALSDDAINAALAPSIYATARALKKHTSAGAFHRIHSIAVDRAFVRSLAREAFAAFPVFANARAGTWYAPRDAMGCYFKSTDGHCNNWSFSSTRLNAHVALETASRGGCVIVDATGSNVKRFPDALAKTVPIWADVLNRACARTMTADEASTWLSSAKDGPFLPHWISDNERNSICERVGTFMASFDAVEYDVRALAKILKKPFRCVWVSRDECPIVDADALDFTPLILLTASAPLHWRGERRVGMNGKNFAYIPGAGDDEESWARGLTPQLFDTHADALLDMPERDVASFIKRIVDGTIVAAVQDVDPRARLPTKGCEHDASVADAMNAADGRLCDGAIRRLSPECGLGECAIASIAVYGRADVHTLADVFIHVGECEVQTPPSMGCVFSHVVAPSVKRDRTALKRAIPTCLEHIFAALRAKPRAKRIFITCDDGIDHSVAVAIAASLARDASTSVDKDAIRARLQRVSATHPDARPSRGSLKQVYAALIDREHHA